MENVKAILGLCMLFFSGCSGLLYYPSRQLHFDPARFGLKPEEVVFNSANGKKLSGWYFRSSAGPARGLVVQFHGNGENMSSHYLSVKWLLNHPYDVFVFDYQGYGRSEGDPSPQNTVEDGIAALEWAHKRNPSLPLAIFGQSLGGAVAMRTVVECKDRIPIRFLAVDSTFPSYRGMGRQVLTRSWITWPFQWIGWLVMSDRYAPQGLIEKIAPIPMLVIHGDQDQIVEIEMGKRVFEQAREPKEFWEIRGGGHTDIFAIQPESYKEKFLARLDAAVKKVR